MSMTDPIADMLTRIRNANKAKHPTVMIPASTMKKSIAQILLEEGYISDYKVTEDDKQGMIEVTMKYDEDNNRVISGLKRVSKPGLRVYAGKDEVPKVMNGLGVVIMSTSKGIMTDRNARKNHIGGEVICYVW
ncbi:MAG: 30S ribosomal protein S8 [Eubacteriaceae bacterium]|nr:30S ribosomal protein S8 [Eubacteriaceae bacterium]MBR5995490.1 30S ribosomal protein S8 [Eubacteriaceae bacterium]